MLGSVNHRTRIDGDGRRNTGDSLRSGVALPEPIGLEFASANHFSFFCQLETYVCGRNGPVK